MRINSFDKNSPRFGALRVHDNVKPLLEKESVEYIQNLKQLGVKLKGFKYIDLVYKDNLIPKIYNTTSKLEKPFDYYQELLREENCLGKTLVIGEGNERVVAKYPEQPYSFIDAFGSKLAVTKYNEFKKLKKEDKLVEFCKMLNEKEEIRIKKDLAEKAAKEAKHIAVKEEIKNLYDSYALDETLNISNVPKKDLGVLTRFINALKK